jgi:hypothetical protein
MGWPERPEEGVEVAETASSLRSWLVQGTHRFRVVRRRGTGANPRARQFLTADTGWLPGDRNGWRGLVTALQRHSVLTALAELHRSDRQILTMAYLQGHTNIEIGRMLHVSARTVSRRLSAALARLEEHARNAGIWIASLVLLGLGFLTRTQERLASYVRSVQWQQAAAVVTAGTAVVALGLVGESAIPTPAQESTFSPPGRSIAVAPLVAGPVAPGPATLPETTTTPSSVNTVATTQASLHQRVVAAPVATGCAPDPTTAPPTVPVGSRTSHPTGAPVAHPGPQARGCKA